MMSLGWALTETLSQTPAEELHAAKFQDSWNGLSMCTWQWAWNHTAGWSKTEGGSGLCPLGSPFFFYTPVAAFRYKLWNEKTKTWKDLPVGQALIRMSMAHPVSLALVFWRLRPGDIGRSFNNTSEFKSCCEIIDVVSLAVKTSLRYYFF